MTGTEQGLVQRHFRNGLAGALRCHLTVWVSRRQWASRGAAEWPRLLKLLLRLTQLVVPGPFKRPSQAVYEARREQQSLTGIGRQSEAAKPSAPRSPHDALGPLQVSSGGGRGGGVTVDLSKRCSHVAREFLSGEGLSSVGQAVSRSFAWEREEPLASWQRWGDAAALQLGGADLGLVRFPCWGGILACGGFL